MATSKEERSYTTTEKMLIAAALLTFVVMAYAYIADISMRRLFFPTAEERMLSTPIGRVAASRGTVQRQRASEFEFKGVGVDTDLFLNDTLMTGPDSTLSIELKDGTKFDLSPNSLIKLTFGSDFSVTGVVRIDILKGSGERTQMPTERKPSPVAISNISPPTKSTLSLTPEEFAERKKPVKVSFTLNHAASDLSLHVFLPARNGQARRELTSIAPKLDNLDVAALFTFNAPGTYEWEAHDGDGAVIGKSEFDISPTVPVIEVLPTLNSSNRLDGSATKKSFDGFVLRWKPLAGPNPYLVRIFKPETGAAIFQKEMTANELILNKNNLLLGRLEFSVEKGMENGFLAVSGKHQFGFEFLPPDPTAPAADTTFNSSSLRETDNLIFFTWSKTNYTDGYEFELAADRSFTKMLVKRGLKDNYESVTSPGPGRYYWRVRSVSSNLRSEYSAIRSLSVSP